MNFGELFLRLAVALVAWLMVFAHCLFLAVLPMTDCSDGGLSAWRMTVASGIAALPLALLLPVGRRIPGLNTILRWFGLPLLLLWPLALQSVWPYLVTATLHGLNVCGSVSEIAVQAGLRQRLWAPFQLLTLAVMMWGGLRYWYPPLPAYAPE